MATHPSSHLRPGRIPWKHPSLPPQRWILEFDRGLAAQRDQRTRDSWRGNQTPPIRKGSLRLGPLKRSHLHLPDRRHHRRARAGRHNPIRWNMPARHRNRSIRPLAHRAEPGLKLDFLFSSGFRQRTCHRQGRAGVFPRNPIVPGFCLKTRRDATHVRILRIRQGGSCLQPHYQQSGIECLLADFAFRFSGGGG